MEHADPVQVVMGALVAASRRVGHVAGSTPALGRSALDGPDLRYVALGAVCVAEERLGGIVRAGAGAARAVARPLASAAAPLVPASVRREVEAAIVRLDAHGRSTVVTGSEEAGEFVAALAGEVAHEPLVLDVIEDIVERVVDRVLPMVLDRLTEEPDQVRALVQGQSRGMVEEVTNAARARAAAGDDAVDRLVARVLHRRSRRGRADPAPAPTLP